MCAARFAPVLKSTHPRPCIAAGRLKWLDLAQGAVLLLTALVRRSFQEDRIDEPVTLLDVFGVNALISRLYST